MVSGVGLGFRREITKEILSLEEERLSFIELAPENWMEIGGALGRTLRQAVEQYPLTCHGLSLSLGSPEPLDWDFLKRLKRFFSEYPVQIYSEHLSFAKCDNAHFYDLLPIPFCESAIAHVVDRIKQVQDFLERKIAIENVSYYCPLAAEMDEASFLRRILEEGGCELLLDVNNVYVNAFNHRYDPYAFIDSLPLEKVSYIHMAGHEKQSEDLILDTHGDPIIDPVYDLLSWTLSKMPPPPVLLERDFQFDSFEDLLKEVDILRGIVQAKSHPYALSQ